MPYESQAIANEFLRIAKGEGKPLTPMQLLKLVFFAHGWHLALTGKPLIDEPVQAWDYGPVIPSLYHEFKKYGNNAITANATSIKHLGGSKFQIHCPNVAFGSTQDTAYVQRLLAKIWEIYGKLTAFQLSNITHEPNSPWLKARVSPPHMKDVDDSAIKDYFSKKRKAQA